MVVMASSKANFLLAFFFFASISLAASNSNLFREYIGADTGNITFSDVPVNPDVDFHFILSFAVDYTLSSPHFPTDGIFAAAWDTAHLTPRGVAAVKRSHANVKVALSLGGDSLGDINVYFVPSSIDSWVHNAVTSLTAIIRQYGLDGIDIDYEHFVADPDTFAECVGRLLATLKAGGLISFASIAPFDEEEVQSHYLALWRKYGHLIDYVNFQFYAYSANTTVPEFLSYFEAQRTNYGGGKLMASFATDKSSEGGLSPERGFFNASRTLKTEGKLDGIFIWSADDSRSDGFRYELQSQELLTNPC